MATHTFPDDQVHFTWDTGNEPVITIADGDTVVIETRDVSDNQIGPDSDTSVIDGLELGPRVSARRADRGRGRRARRHARGRDPRHRTRGWGWTAILPGLGLLADDFPDAYLKIFDISAGDYARFGDEVAIPLTPFMGTMGVCPADASATADHAARPLRREHGHAPARARDDAVPAGGGRGRAVLDRRRARLPGRRRGLRHRARGADVRDAALLAREGPRAPVAAVPHRARLADLARRRRGLVRHDRRRPGPVRRRAERGAGDDRPHHRRSRRSRARTPTCCARCASTSRSPRSSTRASGSSARCCPEAVFTRSVDRRDGRGAAPPAGLRPAAERVRALAGTARAAAGLLRRDGERRLARRTSRTSSASSRPTTTARPSDLALFERTVADLRAFVLAQDVIWVGGGNTASLLAVWRMHGLDAVLREAWEAGVVLCGVSAGMNCWFEASTTDSFDLAGSRRCTTASASCRAAPARTTTARSSGGRCTGGWWRGGRCRPGTPPTTRRRWCSTGRSCARW